MIIYYSRNTQHINFVTWKWGASVTNILKCSSGFGIGEWIDRSGCPNKILHMGHCLDGKERLFSLTDLRTETWSAFLNFVCEAFKICLLSRE